jgi:hypothetical protein
VKVFEFLVSDAKFDAAKRVRFDEIDEFPADGALRKLALEFADEARGSQALEETANGARNANIDLGNAEFDVFVGEKFGEVDVIDADDLAAGSVDDLLVEKILLDGKPGFVGLVGREDAFGDIEIEAAGKDFGDLVVASDEGLEASPGDEEVGDAIRLVGGFNEEFTNTADVVGGGIIRDGAHEFGGVEHVGLVNPFCRDGPGGIVTRLEMRAIEKPIHCFRNREPKSKATQEKWPTQEKPAAEALSYRDPTKIKKPAGGAAYAGEQIRK